MSDENKSYPSSFHMILNNNISKAQWKSFSPKKQQAYLDTMRAFFRHLRDNFRKYLKIGQKTSTSTVKPVIVPHLEIGKVNGKLHYDVIIDSAFKCRLDFTKLRHVLNKITAPYATGAIHMDVKWIGTRRKVLEYSRKDGRRVDF